MRLSQSDNIDGIQQLTRLIKKPQRSLDDLEYIRNFLLQIPFFQSILQNFINNQEIVYDLCNRIKYLETPKSTIIIKQGAKNAQELFILVQGSVYVLMKDIHYKVNGNPVRGLHTLYNNEIQSNGQKDEEQDDQAFLLEVQHYYGKIKATIGKIGCLLGEKALLESRPRAATIMTAESSQFLILSKDDFESVKATYQIHEQSRRNLLKLSFPSIFDSSKYTRLYKEKIYRLFYDHKVYREQIVILPSQRKVNLSTKDCLDDIIFIIFDGEFQVEYFIEQLDESDSNERYQELKRKFIQGSFKKICLLTSGSSLGEEVAFQGEYKYKIQCVSPSGLLIKFSFKELSNVKQNNYTRQVVQYIVSQFTRIGIRKKDLRLIAISTSNLEFLRFGDNQIGNNWEKVDGLKDEPKIKGQKISPQAGGRNDIKKTLGQTGQENKCSLISLWKHLFYRATLIHQYV